MTSFITIHFIIISSSPSGEHESHRRVYYELEDTNGDCRDKSAHVSHTKLKSRCVGFEEEETKSFILTSK